MSRCVFCVCSLRGSKFRKKYGAITDPRQQEAWNSIISLCAPSYPSLIFRSSNRRNAFWPEFYRYTHQGGCTSERRNSVSFKLQSSWSILRWFVTRLGFAPWGGRDQRFKNYCLIEPSILLSRSGDSLNMRFSLRYPTQQISRMIWVMDHIWRNPFYWFRRKTGSPGLIPEIELN